jgi:hypothetical protein
MHAHSNIEPFKMIQNPENKDKKKSKKKKKKGSEHNQIKIDCSLWTWQLKWY